VLNYGRWLLLEPGNVVFAIAPLVRITGLSLNARIALLNDATGKIRRAVLRDQNS
jgi:long-chain acyl-CoA synthetase